MLQDKTKIIYPLVMAFFMAGMMSAILTFVHFGISPKFFTLWGHGFIIAWPCASVVVFIASPIARAVTKRIIELIER